MDAKQVLAMIKEKYVKFVGFRFTDPRGKWQHTARMASATQEDSFTDGVMFDGSSIAGWKAINESDMILMPEPSTAVLDPFTAQTTLILNCDVVEPSTGQLYARCPRSTAKRAEAYMKSSDIGDTAVFGPELEFFVFDDVRDNVQKYKYTLHNVAHSYGKTLTFMPKPLYGDNGSGMHTHQSIWKDNKPLFAGSGYADLSETALYYIGGIIKHAKALNAFCNASTNSYKRVIPGFEAPVLLAYSSRNRSASCRIPYASSPKGKRVEVRFPDPSANPYLAFAAMLMAGLDGIQNKIHPGDPMDKNPRDLGPGR